MSNPDVIIIGGDDNPIDGPDLPGHADRPGDQRFSTEEGNVLVGNGLAPPSRRNHGNDSFFSSQTHGFKNFFQGSRVP